MTAESEPADAPAPDAFAYDDGWETCCNGGRLDDCPYRRNTPEALAWRSGFLDAEAHHD